MGNLKKNIEQQAFAQDSDLVENSSLVHDKIYPANIEERDNIFAVVAAKNVSGREEEIVLQVKRLSAIGGEFLISRKEFETFALENKVDLSLQVGHQMCSYSGLVVWLGEIIGDKRTIGIRWCTEEVDRSLQIAYSEPRQNTRWTTNEEFIPTAVAANPVQFNDMLFFKILDLSREGLRLSTSLRNKFILIGMSFEAIITFPMIGTTTVNFEVQWTKIENRDGKDVLVLGASIKNNSQVLAKIFGQYVFQFGDASSISKLRESGLEVGSTSGGVDFNWVRNEEEYRNVLKLRAISFSWVTGGDEDRYIELADEFDASARILNASYRNRTIGTLRVGYPSNEDVLVHDKYVQIPSTFPRHDQLLEVSRICTHPDFRSSDLFYNMIKQVIVAGVNSKRIWVLGSSKENLLPLYRKIGAQVTDISFDIPEHNVKDLRLFIFNIADVLRGKFVSPIIWKILAEDCLKHCSTSEIVQFDLRDRIRVFYMRVMGSLLFALKRKSKSKK